MLSFAAFALAMAMSGLAGQGLPGIPDDGDGSSVPGLGSTAPDSCSVTSSDPGQRESCNSSGHDGGSGRPGAVHGTGDYRDYRAHPAYREFAAEGVETPRSTSNADHPRSTRTADQPRAVGGGAVSERS